MTEPNELDDLLRQMYREVPAPSAAPDLARRARERATALGRAELARIARLRRWASAATLIAGLAIAYFILHVSLSSIDLSAYRWASVSGSTSAGTSAMNELLILTAAAAGVSVLGAVLMGPALSNGDE